LLSQCSQYKRAVGQDHIRREADEFCSILTRQIQIGRTKAVIDMDIATVRPTQRLKTLLECHDASLRFGIAFNGSDENANAPHSFGLLRARRERPPDRRPADERDERAALHSITSSARASSVGGTSRAERLGRRVIDNEFELGRLQDWQVSRLSALEDASGIDSDLPIRVG